MSDVFEFQRVPDELQQKIVKKMKLLSVILLQQTGKHFRDLVDGIHTPLLEDLRIVQNTPDRGFDKLRGGKDEFKRLMRKERAVCLNLIGEFRSLPRSELQVALLPRIDFARALNFVWTALFGEIESENEEET